MSNQNQRPRNAKILSEAKHKIQKNEYIVYLRAENYVQEMKKGWNLPQ